MENEAKTREAEAARLEGEIAEVCGIINAATGRLVRLIHGVLETGAWEGVGVRSPEQWVAWRCGVGTSRARSLVAMARRLSELPATQAAFEAGELAEDQVAVVARYAPTFTDGEVAELARQTTVGELRRVLRSYQYAEEPTAVAAEPADEVRRVTFGHDDDGSWRLAAILPSDEGALVESALVEARKALSVADKPASWADALVAVACRGDGDRPLVLLHVGATRNGEIGGHLHLGPPLPEGIRRFLSCDARIRPIIDVGGTPVSVGRTSRTVPERTRLVVEERDRGCRVPGCERTRRLHVHHIQHWEDGGATDTANLLALCSFHHRLHHRGGLGIRGDADQLDGVEFTDHRGRRLAASGRPAPPKSPVAEASVALGIPRPSWLHPPGERLDPWAVRFTEPVPERARTG